MCSCAGADLPRYRIQVEYDGSAYHGWQRQAGVSTVQEHLEHAATTACRTPVTVVGSGRTDTGVHAIGQVAHFDLPDDLALTSAMHRLEHSINGILPDDIAVRDLRSAPDNFHARYDARRRCYRYYVSTQWRALDRGRRVQVGASVDFERMNRAANDLQGEHNFSSFCRTQSETENRVCRVYRAHWVAEERPGDWYFVIEADRFLHGMVRAIVGTLVQIGLRKRDEDSLPEILQARDRRVAGPAAKAKGLVLYEVHYDDSTTGEPTN